MAVIVYGDQAVLRIKVAYVSAPEDAMRSELEAWASNAGAAPSELVALADDDGPPLFTIDVAPGVASPREGLVVRAHLFGADADDLESPALLQAVEACDALVLVVAPGREGARLALHAFAQSLASMRALDQAVADLPVVVRRAPARDGGDDVPSSQLESALREMRRQARGGLASVFGGAKRGPLEIVEERDAGRATADTLRRAVAAALRSERVTRYVASVADGARG